MKPCITRIAAGRPLSKAAAPDGATKIQVGERNQRECLLKHVALTVLSRQLSHEAGFAEGEYQSSCTLHSCTVHACLESMLLIQQFIRVGSRCATKQSSTIRVSECEPRTSTHPFCARHITQITGNQSGEGSFVSNRRCGKPSIFKMGAFMVAQVLARLNAECKKYPTCTSGKCSCVVVQTSCVEPSSTRVFSLKQTHFRVSFFGHSIVKATVHCKRAQHRNLSTVWFKCAESLVLVESFL